MKKRFVVPFISLVLLGASFAGCKKTFDLLPQNELDVTQMYRNVFDADAAVMGIYGKFMQLSDRYILLNELRGDLLQFTHNADENIRQLSNHSATETNPLASPRPFYELIIQCNDVLKNFEIMRQDNKMKDLEFQHRFADITALRAFLYLQLGIHYGEVPYITDPLENLDALNNPALFPRLSFNDLLDQLILSLEGVAFKEQYPTGTTLNNTFDTYPSDKFFVNKKVVLADLNLWRGNYVEAAKYYRQVMETGTQGTVNGSYYAFYKLGWDSNGDIDHYISYSRAGDASTLVQNTQWRVMFEQAMNTNGFRYEWVWVIPYDTRFKPVNPLVNLFSPVGGQYLVKPSKAAMDNWDAQQQRPAQGTPGIPYDARGLLSVKEIGGNPVAMKFLYNYLNWNTLQPINVLEKNGKWFLFRQTQLHMRFAEAANRVGKHRLAWGLMNNGIAGAFPAPTSNVTDFHNTLNEAAPFNFDARNSGSSGVPYYRADWYRNIGIRARANLNNLAVPESDSLLQIETDLINETALENAFEGTRWPDLLRIALRRNDPSFLADKIYAKMQKDGIPEADAIRAKLMNKANWYLPFKL